MRRRQLKLQDFRISLLPVPNSGLQIHDIFRDFAPVLRLSEQSSLPLMDNGRLIFWCPAFANIVFYTFFYSLFWGVLDILQQGRQPKHIPYSFYAVSTPVPVPGQLCVTYFIYCLLSLKDKVCVCVCLLFLLDNVPVLPV